jgi:hypothetical protein
LNTLLRSPDFDEWLSHLADQKAKARILARLTSAALGNFGDCEAVGEGVSELRVHVGARDIASITRAPDRPFMFCWRVEQKPRRRKILRKRKEWPANSEARNNGGNNNNEEKENNLQTVRCGSVSR